MKRTPRLEILHQDPDIFVVNKPAGLLTARARWEPDQPTVFSELERLGLGEGVRLVHRLDRETSGLLALARTAEAARSLSEQWRTRTVRKEYLVLVTGSPPEDTFTADLPLLAEPNRERVLAGRRRRSKPARTDFSIVERFAGYTLLRAVLHTGRRHQIRAHLQAAGHPIVADALYGDGRPLLLSQLKRNWRGRDETPLMARAALHACRLEFDHPRTAERLRFDAPIPKDLAIALKNLRRYARS